MNSINIGALDKAIKAWLVSNVHALAEYNTLHQCISPTAFNALLTLEPAACAYCQITKSQFDTLRQAGQLHTKRLRTRGTSFEIDCRRPELGYTEGNLALCCYWCNNAKTDEFSDAEFQPVADALALVWRRRLVGLEQL